MNNVKAFITDVNRDGFHEVAEAIRATGGKDAENINYNNSASGLDADNVQAAIDEVSGDVSDLETSVSGKANKSDITTFSVTKSSGGTGSISFKPSIYDRYGIFIFGNGNGNSLMGTILIEGSSNGYVRSSANVFINSVASTLTVTHNTDDTITVSGLDGWGMYTLISPYALS